MTRFQRAAICLSALAVLAFLMPVSAPADEAEGGWPELEGEWEVVNVEVDGQRMEPAGQKFNECTILAPRAGAESGTHSVGWFIFYLDGRLFEEWPVLEIDPAAEPNALRLQSRAPDPLVEDRVNQSPRFHAGLYRLEGDTLTVCLSRGVASEGGPARPENFSAAAGTDQTLIELKRRPADDHAR
jgi:uncharacterized protein (TIGR03067 family)